VTAGPDAMVLTDDDRRAVARWAADCAERALPLFASRLPGDTRPRQAIAGARAYADGGERKAALRTLALAALAAAREAGDPAATAAARAAGYAASTAYVHALPTRDQAKHVLDPAVHLALAQELAGGDADHEIGWAVTQASPTVRDVLGRFPPAAQGRTRLAVLRHRLDGALR
jgi:hypothetical protein